MKTEMFEEVMQRINSIQAANQKQGENIVTAVTSIEQAIKDISEIVKHVKSLNIPFEEKQPVLHMLYATVNALRTAETEIRFNC